MDVDWIAFFQEDVLSANVLAALLVLVGVVITAVVTTILANRSRRSIEKTAADRLDAEQKQKALDRSFPDRAKTYLEARAWLKRFGDLTYNGILNDIWDSDGWEEAFSDATREEIRNKIEVYGTSNAAELFEATAQAFWQSCHSKRRSHQLLAMRRSGGEEHGLDSPFYKHLDQDLYLQQEAAETEGEDYHGHGYRLLERFTKLIQEDLADADTAKKELVIPPVGNERNRQITRQRRRKFEGLPAVEEGEEEIEDWGN